MKSFHRVSHINKLQGKIVPKAYVCMPFASVHANIAWIMKKGRKADTMSTTTTMTAKLFCYLYCRFMQEFNILLCV